MSRFKQSWAVAKAKARLSEVIQKAVAEGPQEITKSGHPIAVIVSADEWDRKTKRAGNLAEFLTASPLRGSKLKIERRRDRSRKVGL
jgi:prevent-host-death family protein